MYTLLCRNIGIAPHGSLYASDRVKMLQLATMSRLHSRSRSMSGSGRYIGDSGATTPWYRWGALNGSKVRQWFRSSLWAQRSLFVMSIIATAMVLGDGVLTPAISGGQTNGCPGRHDVATHQAGQGTYCWCHWLLSKRPSHLTRQFRQAVPCLSSGC